MKTVSLGDVAQLIRGVSFDGGEASAVDRPDHLPILRAGNIADTLLTDRELVWVPAARVAENQQMSIGDVAICLSSGSASVVGKTALLTHEFRGSVGAFCAIVRPRRGLNSEYLAYWLRSPSYREWRDAQSRGANIQNLRLSELAKVALPLPSPNEQQRLAAHLNEALSAADRARNAAVVRGQALAALRDVIVDAAFRDLNVERLALGKLGALTDGDWILTADYAPSGVRLLQVGDVGRGQLTVKSSRFISVERARQLNCTMLRPGDILISRMADPIGRACMLPDLGYPAITAVDVTIFRHDARLVTPEFMLRFMNSRGWLAMVASKASGATRPRISRRQLELLSVPLPVPEVQRQVAATLRKRLSLIESAFAAASAAAGAVDLLPSSILRDAFRSVA